MTDHPQLNPIIGVIDDYLLEGDMSNEATQSIVHEPKFAEYWALTDMEGKYIQADITTNLLEIYEDEYHAMVNVQPNTKVSRVYITASPPEAQTAPVQEPDWSYSQTELSSLWKNPAYPQSDRLIVADGTIAYERKVNENLRKRIAEMSVDSWQPIKTAPKTNKAILVYCAERKNIYAVYWGRVGDSWEKECWVHVGDGELLETPTYWMSMLTTPPEMEIK